MDTFFEILVGNSNNEREVNLQIIYDFKNLVDKVDGEIISIQVMPISEMRTHYHGMYEATDAWTPYTVEFTNFFVTYKPDKKVHYEPPKVEEESEI